MGIILSTKDKGVVNMISIILKGHDYKYEISELVKLFTSEFEYVDEKHFGRVLELSLIHI